MLKVAFACLALACAVPASAAVSDARPAAPAPQARFVYGDLRLDSAAGQNALVERVLDGARAYCRDHAAIVTPPARRVTGQYCVDSMRIQFMQAMPAHVRAAFDRGWTRRSRRPGGA